jgi:Protein of unknown function (DUF2971)
MAIFDWSRQYPIETGNALYFSASDAPERKWIYHYTRVESFHKIIDSQKLRFSSADLLNDPRESKGNRSIEVRGEVGGSPEANKILFREIQRIREVVSRVRENAFIGSFSVDAAGMAGRSERGYAIPTMWAHYGDNHRGVCMVFEREKLVDSVVRQIGGVPHEGSLTYDADLASVPSFDFLQTKSKSDRELEAELALDYRNLWFRKYACWSSEREYRIAIPKNNLDRYLEIPLNPGLIGVCLGVDVAVKDANSVAAAALNSGIHEVPSLYWDAGYGQARVPIMTPWGHVAAPLVAAPGFTPSS